MICSHGIFESTVDDLLVQARRRVERADEEMDQQILRMILSEVDDLLRANAKVVNVGLHVSSALSRCPEIVEHSDYETVQNSLGGPASHNWQLEESNLRDSDCGVLRNIIEL